MPQRVIFPAPWEVLLQSFDPAPPVSTEVLIETDYSVMSIGTETTILHKRYAEDSHFAKMFSFPQLKTGVQAVGRVVETGDEATQFEPGDRVFMRQAHGSHQVVDQALLSPVPAQIDSLNACWCGLAKTAFRAAWAAPFDPDAHVLIIGAGPVGQMAVRWAALFGVASLTVVDLSAFRLESARSGGASACIEGAVHDHVDQLCAIDDGKGPSIVIDSTGNAAVLTSALEVCARFGKIVLLGDTGFPDRQHLSKAMMIKGLCVQATHDSHDRDGWTQRKIDALFYNAVSAGRFPLEGLINKIFKPSDCKKAYALAERDRGTVLGIAFDWR